MNLNILKQMTKNSIRITYNTVSAAECQIGKSKIGGKPDLPENFNWFYFEGKSYEDIQENRPLSFLAQINCEEVKPFDTENLLPSKGMLYFFYEIETMTWGFDPTDKGSAKVYYYSGSLSDINRTEFPADLSDDYNFPEMSINFSSKNELPDFEEFIEWNNEIEYDKWDAYDEEKSKIVALSEEENINKLLGYADLVQGGMLLTCEETTNGFNTGSDEEVPQDILAQFKKDCTKWQLLFQLDSIVTSEYEMMWGDLGRVYFYIRSEDLKNLNFDNCWLQLQCG